MWIPKQPPLEELDSVDPDVQPVDARRRDLGIPDGGWWGATIVASFASGLPLVGWVGNGIGAGPVPAECVFLGWWTAGVVFAAERWGHRRYRFRHALRDAARILAAGVVAAFTAFLAARLGWHLP